MNRHISSMLAEYESGRISRRELVASLGSLMALLATRGTPATADTNRTDDEPLFQATGLNHIALNVTDVPRSRDWYVQHLGLKVTRDGTSSCFLDCGKHFVALFANETPGMHHYCYSIDEYNVTDCEARLRQAGIEPRVVRDDGRIYFPDPDGLTVQLAQRPR